MMGKRYWLLVILISLIAFISACRSDHTPPEPVTKEKEPAPASEFDQIPLIQNLTAKISEEPNNPKLFFMRSKAYMELGNHVSALEDIKQAIQLDSTAGEFYMALGEIYFSRQEYTRAITALEKGRQEDPDNLDLSLQLAKYYLYVGERPKSIQLLDEVLKKNVFNAEAYFLKGMIFKEIGDTAKSISNFQTSVEQNPRFYKAYMQLGLLLSKKKDKLALDYFNNALRIDSTSYEAKYGIAMFYQESGDFANALAHYQKLIVEYPYEKDAFYNIGYIHFQMDSVDRASRDFERAIGVAPDFADAYYMRGLCSEVKKDIKNARFYYQQALNLKPQHQLALNGLKRLEQL